MALGPPSVPTPVGPGPSPQSSFAVVLGVCPVSARGGVLLADVGHVIRTQGQVPLPGHHVPACPALCRPLGRRRADSGLAALPKSASGQPQTNWQVAMRWPDSPSLRRATSLR